jgi:hypothetical protein
VVAGRPLVVPSPATVKIDCACNDTEIAAAAIAVTTAEA